MAKHMVLTYLHFRILEISHGFSQLTIVISSISHSYWSPKTGHFPNQQPVLAPRAMAAGTTNMGVLRRRFQCSNCRLAGEVLTNDFTGISLGEWAGCHQQYDIWLVVIWKWEIWLFTLTLRDGMG